MVRRARLGSGLSSTVDTSSDALGVIGITIDITDVPKDRLENYILEQLRDAARIIAPRWAKENE